MPELLGLCLHTRIHHPSDDEDIVRIVLDLGPLVHVDDILEREGMEPEELADRFDLFDVSDTFDIHPGVRSAFAAARSISCTE